MSISVSSISYIDIGIIDIRYGYRYHRYQVSISVWSILCIDIIDVRYRYHYHRSQVSHAVSSYRLSYHTWPYDDLSYAYPLPPLLGFVAGLVQTVDILTKMATRSVMIRTRWPNMSRDKSKISKRLQSGKLFQDPTSRPQAPRSAES